MMDPAVWKGFETWVAESILGGVRIPGSGGSHKGWEHLKGDSVNDYFLLDCKYTGNKKGTLPCTYLHYEDVIKNCKQAEEEKKYGGVVLGLKGMNRIKSVIVIPFETYKLICGSSLPLPQTYIFSKNTKQKSICLGKGLFEMLSKPTTRTITIETEKYTIYDKEPGICLVLQNIYLYLINVVIFRNIIEAKGLKKYTKGVKL